MPPKEALSTQNVEADTDDTSSGTGSDDFDSVYASDDAASATTSLASFVKNYKTHFGRRYHSDTFDAEKWLVPNDEAQQDQMDIFHAVHCRAKAINKGEHLQDPKAEALFLAPVPERPQKVLDLATGTGLWAIQFADAYPSAQVIGTDIAPIQPEWVPPNLQFEIHDMESDWTFGRNVFDFIHARSLHASVKDWPRLLKQAYDALKPGGWIEISHEAPYPSSDDGTLKDDNDIVKWLKNTERACDMIGRTSSPFLKLPEWLPEAGFTNIEHRMLKLPVGVWPKDKVLKELGAMMLVGMLSGIEGWILQLYTMVLQRDEDETRADIKAVAKALKNRKTHTWMPLHVFIARKPE